MTTPASIVTNKQEQTHQEYLRAERLRESAHRQSLAVAESYNEPEDQAFVDAVSVVTLK
jgi:hypothetical protein